ncbi:SOS response-associated peptidase [Ammoniphilus sp. CFH 90114]|uniref:SOS response-associated peptidase n=1 Tax=Ammoniphilus sp. CFH 90114 TaxID=2493665 RepID=UPI00100F7A02|nr:SOS response-associated peptidase [Ammoniphilus sp. CFH 90114]RXT02302.1 SOS response-associated peptidase [Ammoniphilus sp. CFH 90114]
MCGRFTLTGDFGELLLRYLIEEWAAPKPKPRYNIAPMQMIMAVVNDGEKNRLGRLRWGLVPSWAKDESMAGKMINARAESLLEKASFKKLVDRRRCIIPADSFYEWKTMNGKKQPIRFQLKEGGVFSFAGLYDIWIHPDHGQRVSTCTIITTSPNSLIAEVHNRMPAILQKQDEQKWLDRHNTEIKEVMSLLRPYPEGDMVSYPVSSVVGNVRNDSPECIERVELLY